ncbi:hypothetical protein KAT08_04045 [Candidatus Babeliales bacterium]|nr:hypothetical protein [Candidatus Babeliales bacterium]
MKKFCILSFTFFLTFNYAFFMQSDSLKDQNSYVDKEMIKDVKREQKEVKKIINKFMREIKKFKSGYIKEELEKIKKNFDQLSNLNKKSTMEEVSHLIFCLEIIKKDLDRLF